MSSLMQYQVPEAWEAPGGSERPRVLQLSYSCMPNRGSEPGMGWNRAVESAKRFDTWVICREDDCREEIEEYLDRHGPVEGLHFEFIPSTSLERKMGRFSGLRHVANNLWHRRAFEVAKRLHEEIQFDLVHQVTYCSYREPGYLWMLDAPFIWGPVGGAQNYPWRFLRTAGLLPAMQEGLRNILNEVQMRFSPRVRRAARRAELLLAANTTNRDAIVRAHQVEAITFPETGMQGLSLNHSRKHHGGPLRILWCGVLEPRKALHLLIEALSQLPRDLSWELHVVGTGPQANRLQRMAKAFGVSERISWLGFIPHREALARFDWADVFAFTSLRDTSGTVVLEALGAGLPVVCLDHQGAADIVESSCGIKIPVTSPKSAVADFTAAIERLARDAEWREELAQGSLRRAEYYLWTEQGTRMAECYRRVLRQSKANVE